MNPRWKSNKTDKIDVITIYEKQLPHGSQDK